MICAHWTTYAQPTGPSMPNPLDHLCPTHWTIYAPPTGPSMPNSLEHLCQTHWTIYAPPTGPSMPNPLDHLCPTHWTIYAPPTGPSMPNPLDHLCPTHWNVLLMESLYLVNVAKYNFFLALQGSGEEVVQELQKEPLRNRKEKKSIIKYIIKYIHSLSLLSVKH